MELQDLQQGDAGYHLGPRRVKTFPQRSSPPGGNLDGLQEPQVLYNSQETQLLSIGSCILPTLTSLSATALDNL